MLADIDPRIRWGLIGLGALFILIFVIIALNFGVIYIRALFSNATIALLCTLSSCPSM